MLVFHGVKVGTEKKGRRCGMKTLRSQVRTARKGHVCSLCGGIIHKGENYELQKNICDGRMYQFKSHLHCRDLSSAIWDYVDPYEGMTGMEFSDAVIDLATTFYCPRHCDCWKKPDSDCEGFDSDECTKKFAKFMETHKLDLIRDPVRGMCWRMVKKEGGAK